MSIVSLYTAVSALQAHQQFLSTVANNLANVNTVGFKGSRTLFADSLSQTVRPPTQSTATTAGGNGVQRCWAALCSYCLGRSAREVWVESVMGKNSIGHG